MSDSALETLAEEHYDGIHERRRNPLCPLCVSCVEALLIHQAEEEDGDYATE